MKDIAERTPVASFGTVLGIAGLGSAWRLAHLVWGLPAAIGEAILGLAATVWIVLLVLYGTKWRHARPAALAEFRHPVQSCFVAFVPMATMLIALAAQPYAGTAALCLFLAAAACSGAYAVHHAGHLSRGGRDPAGVTPALVLPVVGFCFITAIGAGAFGFHAWGQIAWGAGLIAWFPIEAAVRFRLFAVPALPPPLRPTMGILLAPTAVGAVAYLSVSVGPPDRIAEYMVGYGLLQAALLLRLLPWIGTQPFAAPWWAFGFGIEALAIAPLLFIQHGGGGPLAMLAPILFVLANLVIGALLVGSLVLLLQGRFLPRNA
jgi:tellurite resistance protein